MAVALVHGLHHQRVGDHHAVVADAVPQDAGQDLARQRGRVLGIELRVDDVRRHHGRRRLLTRGQGAEGQQLQRLQLGQALVHRRQGVVRIDMGVAMAREMLDAAGHPLAQRAAHPGPGHARHQGRVLAEAALADDRVGRVVVDVQHRREVPVDAQVTQAARHRRADLLGQGLVADGAQRHRGRRLRQAGGPHDRAALLVDADQRPLAHRGTQVGGQLADLVLVAEVLAEQADGADLLAAQELGGVGVERLAGNVDHHQLAGVDCSCHLGLVSGSW